MENTIKEQKVKQKKTFEILLFSSDRKSSSFETTEADDFVKRTLQIF